MHPSLSDTQVTLRRVRELTHAAPALWFVFRHVYNFPHLQLEVCRYIPNAYTTFYSCCLSFLSFDCRKKLKCILLLKLVVKCKLKCSSFFAIVHIRLSIIRMLLPEEKEL